MNTIQLNVIALAVLAGGAASAAPPATPAPLPTFATISGCGTVKGYDPAWAGHGERYAVAGDAGKDHFVSGFYQLAEHGERIYAAFGGALTQGRQPVPGVTPGALVVLDANTLKLERFIPLPFHAHSLVVQPTQNRVIATHTRANAFSSVDLATGAVRCIKPSTTAGQEEFRGRYATGDAQGNVYLSYHAGAGDTARSVIAKYGSDLQAARGYTPVVAEHAMALPAFYRAGQVITGGQSVTAVSASDGSARRLLPGNPGWSIYNYAAGPGHTLLATNHKQDGSPNLLLIDPATNSSSAILTGTDSLEAAYVAESGQVFATNFGSNTVTVAALAADGSGFAPQRFVNIVLQGKPLGLATRRTAQGTEVFVTTKWAGDVVHKIVIAPAVRGIEGIGQSGHCTVARFDLADRSVSPAQACEILDAKASYAALHRAQQGTLQEATQELRDAQSALQQARQPPPGATPAGQLAALEEAVREAQAALAEATANRDMFARLASD